MLKKVAYLQARLRVPRRKAVYTRVTEYFFKFISILLPNFSRRDRDTFPLSDSVILSKIYVRARRVLSAERDF